MTSGTKRFLGVLLAICLMLSMVPAAVFAADPASVLYLKPSNGWLSDGARFAAYYFDAAGSYTWADMTDADGDGYYSCAVPTGFSSVIFVRMNGSNTANNWDNKWNQTSDLSIPTNNNNCYVVSSGWDGDIGSWTVYSTDPTDPTVTDPTVTDPTETTPSGSGSQTGGGDVQNGVTLHCWNWSFKNIEANMAKIASLGYTAIQTNPIQGLKQATANYSMSDWWVYYQPADFSISTSSSNALGTKADFISMCSTAHKYGIKVIVDVVANHMADNGANKKHSAIIDDLENDSSCWHDISKNIENYYNRYDITQYCLGGLPDLNTSNKKVQNYVLSFLKECIDAGADGFRFDAVKHIETPEDSYCGSDFWPTVINGAESYAASTRGIDLYCYGELLYHPEDGGSVSDSIYTKYFSVTDNSWGDAVRNNVVNGYNAGAFNYSYHKNANANQLVLWAESHDTYAEDVKNNRVTSVSNINKAWALAAARADAMSLYLARPQNMHPQKLGAVTTGGWDDGAVAAVNQFHNAFVGQNEYVANENGFAYVERGTAGVVIVDCACNSSSVSITAHQMANGTYTDQVSGNTFTVSNGKITGKMGSTGIAVLYNAGDASCDHKSHNTDGTCAACGAYVGHTFVNGSCVCGAEQGTVSGTDYYLFGYINGADYASGEDHANLGEYKFVNGKLTVTFNETSYVGVKTADNRWYMTNGWQGEVTSVTLYNTTVIGENANKLMVPGGVEVTLTLVDNGDDTLTLSYATGSVEPELPEGAYDVSGYRSGSTYTYPVKEGFVFAGWYTDAALTQPLDKDTTTGIAYAKFVSEKVLSVKWQVTAGTTASTPSTTLRLVTTVDSLNYSNVGFRFRIGEGKWNTRTSTTVYSQIKSNTAGVVFNYAPTVFHETAKYFLTRTVTGVPSSAYDTTWTVEPFWVTLDGTEVTGVSRSFKISDFYNR